MGILGAILGKRDAGLAYRTVDGGHPAPYPDMTDEQLYNYEMAFNVPRKTFDQPPVSTRAHTEDSSNGRRYGVGAQAFLNSQNTSPDADQRQHSFEDTQPADGHQWQEPQWQEPVAHASETSGLDLSKPVRTITTGQPVEIVTTKARHPVYKVHGYIGDDSVLTVFTIDGRLSENGAPFLENTPEQRHLHLNIYPNPDPRSRERYLLTQHDSVEDAEASAMDRRIACVKVQFDL